MTSTDPLKFVDTKPYTLRIKEARKLSMNDAVITAEGQLNGRPVVICAMEFGFYRRLMGAVVGEKLRVASNSPWTHVSRSSWSPAPVAPV
jgi:acetyl-CoA carboxylase carboxyl transferase subunit beta